MTKAGVEVPDELVEAIAERVAERVVALLATESRLRLLDAAGLARRLGRTRAFVYEHATELGALHVGDGPRPRLFFPWPEAVERMTARSAGGRSEHPESGANDRKTGHRRADRLGRRAGLLPIRGPGP